jgi:hypothetical protein
MDGPAEPVTVNESRPATKGPPDTDTLMGPVIDPLGTMTTNCVELAEVIVATDGPVNFTVSLLDVLLNPVPVMATVAPTAPLTGATPTIDTWLVG